MTLLLFVVPGAMAATCDAGYYLQDGKCAECNPNNLPYYCPGDDTRHHCPPNDADIASLSGGTIIHQGQGWAVGATSKSAYECVGGTWVRVANGEYLSECRWDGINYFNRCGGAFLWYNAVPGYYLSQYRWSSSYHWYYGVKPCTNAPEHAHYTGSGTPDEPKSGGATDYNDCPWECDNGYGRHGDECVPLCATITQYIKTGNGLSFNLYPIAYSSPTIVVKYNGTMCYGVLSPGGVSSAINVNYNGSIYHLEN